MGQTAKAPARGSQGKPEITAVASSKSAQVKAKNMARRPKFFLGLKKTVRVNKLCAMAKQAETANAHEIAAINGNSPTFWMGR